MGSAANRMGKPLKYLFTLGIPLALAGLGVVYMLDPQGRSEAGLVYETAPVERGAIRKIVATSGPVRALVTVSVCLMRLPVTSIVSRVLDWLVASVAASCANAIAGNENSNETCTAVVSR